MGKKKTKNVDPAKIRVNKNELDELIEWMIAGQPSEALIRSLKNSFPRSNHEALFFHATEHFRKVADCDTEMILGWCLESTRSIYQKMLEDGDLPGALRAIKQLRDFSK